MALRVTMGKTKERKANENEELGCRDIEQRSGVPREVLIRCTKEISFRVFHFLFDIKLGDLVAQSYIGSL